MNRTLCIILSLILALSAFTACADTNAPASGDTLTTGDSVVSEDTLPDEPEITTTKTYDISRYERSSEFLAVIYNDVPYYYSENIYDPQELAYYLSLAEYVGQVESDADENPSVVEYFLEDGTPVYAEQFPTENFQSNFLAIGTKLYILGDYMIAEFAEPWDNGRIVYGQVMKLTIVDEVESGAEIVVDIELPAVEVEPEPEIEIEVEVEEEPVLTSDPGAEEISLDREPIYFDVQIFERLSGSGEPATYEELATESLENSDNLRFIAYEITKVFTPEEAYNITGADQFLNITSLYEAHITYDYIADCELDKYVYMGHAGSAKMQYENMPAYTVGDRFVAEVIGDPADRLVPSSELEFSIYEIDGVEYAYKHGERIKLTSDDPDLDLPMSASEKLVITTTDGNPTRYTQKSTLESVIKFIREDWSQRGIGLPFPKSPDVALPWEISEPTIDYRETLENSVTFELLHYSLTSCGAEFRMLNLSGKNLTTGNSFAIEIFKDGEWNYIDIGIVTFPAEAFNYETGLNYDIRIDWTNYYGELVPGKYRIIKEYSLEGSSEVYYAICVFIIRE